MNSDNNPSSVNTKSPFNVPRFPGLLSELDYETLFRTPPDNNHEWSMFYRWNSHRLDKTKPLFPQWEILTENYPGINTRVIIYGFGTRNPKYPNIYYLVQNHNVSTILPYEGLLAHFYHRIKSTLVKNGIPEDFVNANFNCVNKLTNWFVGYEEASGQITIFDPKHPGVDYQMSRFRNGLPVLDPKLPNIE